jgi:hypothetical protein
MFYRVGSSLLLFFFWPHTRLPKLLRQSFPSPSRTIPKRRAYLQAAPLPARNGERRVLGSAEFGRKEQIFQSRGCQIHQRIGQNETRGQTNQEHRFQSSRAQRDSSTLCSTRHPRLLSIHRLLVRASRSNHGALVGLIPGASLGTGLTNSARFFTLANTKPF